MIDPKTIDLSDPRLLPGVKPIAKDLKAAASSDNAVVTYTMLKIMEEGGNAIDAGIAGAMVQATIEPFMTNHTGTVTFLCYIAKENRFYQLDSTGTFPAGVPLNAPVPAGMGPYAIPPGPYCCIPGFMPGIKAIYDRFGTMPWSSLCEDAVWWAENGHHVSCYEADQNNYTQDFTTYFSEGRKFFMPDGRLPYVGERFKSHELADTLRNVMECGPEYMITGRWAEHFVRKGNEMGWQVKLSHMTETPPRWIEPVRFKIGEYEVVSLAPPQQQGIYLAMVLNILEQLGIREIEPYSAEHIFYMGHALKMAAHMCGYTCDPEVLSFDSKMFLDNDFHCHLAKLIKGMVPKVDLTEHMNLTTGYGADGAKGKRPTRHSSASNQPAGSCELSIVDKQGNWVQMMDTLQSGGIPAQVVDGVFMYGSHARPNVQDSYMQMYLTKGSRMRSIIGNTMLLKDGRPVLSLGTPANVHCTVAQVLCNLIFFGMEPYAAVEAPRMLPLVDGGTLLIEDRISEKAQDELLALGIRMRVSSAWDSHMGSFQMCYLDRKTNKLCAVADPRRCGVADGIK